MHLSSLQDLSNSLLALQNFKSWKRAEVEFSPLTAFFNTNSSGKSSLSQFLLLLKQTKDSTDRSVVLDFGGPDSITDVGSYRDAVFGHDEQLPISWTLRWEMDEELRLINPMRRNKVLLHGTDIELSSRVSCKNRTISPEILSYKFSDNEFSLSKKSGKSGFELASTRLDGEESFRFTRAMGREWDLSGPIKSYAFPDQARTYFTNSETILGELETSYVRQIDKIFHLGPLRNHPRRQYTWSGSRPNDVGNRGERTVEAVMAATIANEKRNRRRKTRLMPFQNIIAWWLQEMGLIYDFRIAEITKDSGLYRTFVRQSPYSPEAQITDVGFGVSQVYQSRFYFIMCQRDRLSYLSSQKSIYIQLFRPD